MMEHKSFENAAVAQLTAVLSTETVPWDSSGVSSKNIILNTGQCSEEHVLKCTFKACDPEQTGEVSVFRIIEYLQEMTGQSCEDWRFQSLYKRLDPEERGITVDFSTFYAVMKDWITDCRQEGIIAVMSLGPTWTKMSSISHFYQSFGLEPYGLENWHKNKIQSNYSAMLILVCSPFFNWTCSESDREEAADLMNSIKDLQQGNKQLAVQNIKLQRTIETAEELNLRLSEEISELKGKLRSTQQALEQAKAVANELEDLKFFSKNLEEENNRLHTQIRQLEKEQQLLSVQMDNLQEENKKLILEKENSKCKIKELFTKKAKMKSQLCEYENLISCKDAALNEKTKQTEELTVILNEYRTVVEDLKLEIKSLQDHLYQSYQHPDMQPRDSLQNVKTSLQVPMQPLCMEIEESQKQELGEDEGLPSPLCGMLSSFMKHPVTLENTRSLAEELEMDRSRADSPRALLQRTHSLPHLTLVADAKLILRKKEHHHEQRYFPSEMVERSPETALQEQALVPVHGELTPAIEKQSDGTLFEILLQRFCDVPLDHLLYSLQKSVLARLLPCGLLLAIFFLVLPYDQHPTWIEVKGPNPWSQLQLQYLRPPPI